jgi:hypothetical protein
MEALQAPPENQIAVFFMGVSLSPQLLSWPGST